MKYSEAIPWEGKLLETEWHRVCQSHLPPQKLLSVFPGKCSNLQTQLLVRAFTTPTQPCPPLDEILCLFTAECDLMSLKRALEGLECVQVRLCLNV